MALQRGRNESPKESKSVFGKQQVINDTLAANEMLMGTDELDIEITERQARIEEISKAVALMVRENARTVQD